MAILAPILPYLAAGAAVAGTAASIDQNRRSSNAQKDARRQQENARGEQQAQQNAEAAQARRQQIREARIKRAQILQASENTRTAGSSGETGAVGGINTALGSNMGLSQANIERSQRIGAFNQAASDFMSDAQSHANRGQMFGQVANMGFNLIEYQQKLNAQAAKKQGTT